MTKLIPLTTLPDNLIDVWDGYRVSRTILLVYPSGGMVTGSYQECYDEGTGEIEGACWRTDCPGGFDVSQCIIGWLELPTVEL